MITADTKNVMTAGEAVAKCIQKESVEKVFCVPGESYLPVLNALYDMPNIDVISTRHEGGASFMAEGYAKTSNSTGVVFATRGVGATNLSIGIHTAQQDSTPLVVFLGQVDSKFLGREAFQEINFDKYFQSVAKWTAEIREPERTTEIVQRAFRIAKSGRPGPVIISLPEDILYQESEMKFGPVSVKPKPVPADDEIMRIEKMLNTAKKPLILAGGGIFLSNAEDKLFKFATTYNIPVMAGFGRHSVFPNEHPLYLGHIGFSTDKKIISSINEADVILAFGTRLSEPTTDGYSLITDDKKLIHVDIDYKVIGSVFSPEIGIVADIGEALTKLTNMNLNNISWKDWVTNRRSQYEKMTKLECTEEDHINKKIMKVLNEKLPEETIFSIDAGNFAGWVNTFCKFNQTKKFIGSTNGAMGYALPAAIGAKFAYPEKTILSFSGDGGFMMTGQEIETSIRCNVPIISLVFNNNMYGTIRAHQEQHFPGRVIATDLGDVSFASMAKSLGAEGFVVRTEEEFEIALNKALNSDKSVLIEIVYSKEQLSVNKTISEIRQ